jgi:hypothetical protein
MTRFSYSAVSSVINIECFIQGLLAVASIVVLMSSSVGTSAVLCAVIHALPESSGWLTSRQVVCRAWSNANSPRSFLCTPTASKEKCFDKKSCIVQLWEQVTKIALCTYVCKSFVLVCSLNEKLRHSFKILRWLRNRSV